MTVAKIGNIAPQKRSIAYEYTSKTILFIHIQNRKLRNADIKLNNKKKSKALYKVCRAVTYIDKKLVI